MSSMSLRSQLNLALSPLFSVTILMQEFSEFSLLPLHLALKSGDLPTVEYLLSQGGSNSLELTDIVRTSPPPPPPLSLSLSLS
jgi:hypothetical protein